MLRRSALFLALLLFCLCGGQLQTEPDAEQPLSSQPLFEGEAGLLEQSAAGNVPETIVRDFEDQKAVVSVLGDDGADQVTGDTAVPQTAGEVVALLDKSVTFNETVLDALGQKTAFLFSLRRPCNDDIPKTKWMFMAMRHNCTAHSFGPAYAAARLFALTPQPVSRIERLLAKAKAGGSKQPVNGPRQALISVHLEFALFRQARREIELLEQVRTSVCSGSAPCEAAVDEVRRQRERSAAKVVGPSLASGDLCFGRVKDAATCIASMVREFEALPPNANTSTILEFAWRFTGRDKNPVSSKAVEIANQTLSSAIANFTACGFSRSCKRLVRTQVLKMQHIMTTIDRLSLSKMVAPQNRAVTYCRVDCDMEKLFWRVLGNAGSQRVINTLRLAYILQVLSCNTTKCVEALDLLAGQQLIYLSAVLERSGYVANSFAGRDVILSGIIFCGIVLAAAIGVAVFGLVVRQLWQRTVWMLVLGGVMAANTLFLYAWLSQQLVGGAGPTADWPLTPAIAYSVALIVAVLFSLLMLLLLNLYVSGGKSNKAFVLFAVAGALLVSGVIAVISVLFAMPGWALWFSTYVSDPVVTDFVPTSCRLLFGSSICVALVCLGLSAWLLVLMVQALRASSRAMRGLDGVRKRALVVNVVLCGLMCATFLAQSVISTLRFPWLGVESELLIYVGGLVVPTAVLSLACVGLVFNAWWASHALGRGSEASSKLLTDSYSFSSGEADIPARYND